MMYFHHNNKRCTTLGKMNVDVNTFAKTIPAEFRVV